jgi:hypothetical protein
MHSKAFRSLLAIAVLSVLLAPATAGEGSSALDAFLRVSEETLDGWATLRREQAQLLAEIETARAEARRLERSKSAAVRPWRERWARSETARAGVQLQAKKLLTPWIQRLRALVAEARMKPLPESDRSRVASRCLACLEQGVRAAEPGGMLVLLAAERETLGLALGWVDAAERRALLAVVVDRLASTPGYSDLDVLCDVVRWDALFLGSLEAGQPQLDALSTDLILLFTERAANGVALSRSKLYGGGRFGSLGFRKDLRDGSDQVRHFTWAFRMFARSKNNDAMEKLLTLKERADAKLRKQPLNQADMILNRAARRLVEQILDERIDAEAAAKASRPIRIERYAEIIRKELE